MSKSSTDLKGLNSFIRKNKSLDLRTVDLLNQNKIDTFNWSNLENEKSEIVSQLKAYQRILRILPKGKEAIAKSLLKNGIQSSLQIASTPKNKFIKENIKIFENDSALALQVYKRAIALRKAVSLQYLNKSQQTEPHARAAGIHR